VCGDPERGREAPERRGGRGSGGRGPVHHRRVRRSPRRGRSPGTSSRARHDSRGYAHLRRGDREGAIDEFTRAAELSPLFPEPFAARGLETYPSATAVLDLQAAIERGEARELLRVLRPKEDALPRLVEQVREAARRRAEGDLAGAHWQCTKALGACPPEPAARAIGALLDETPPLHDEVRQGLLSALAEIEAPAIAGPALVKHLPGMPGWCREKVAKRLGELLYRDAVPARIELLRDPEVGVRRAAKGALDEIKLYYREKEE
jgi:hypothetical protein